jgi:hypothetical protein
MNNFGDYELIIFAKILTFAQHFAPNLSISHKDVHYKTMKRKRQFTVFTNEEHCRT